MKKIKTRTGDWCSVGSRFIVRGGSVVSKDVWDVDRAVFWFLHVWGLWGFVHRGSSFLGRFAHWFGILPSDASLGAVYRCFCELFEIEDQLILLVDKVRLMGHRFYKVWDVGWESRWVSKTGPKRLSHTLSSSQDSIHIPNRQFYERPYTGLLIIAFTGSLSLV